MFQKQNVVSSSETREMWEHEWSLQKFTKRFLKGRFEFAEEISVCAIEESDIACIWERNTWVGSCKWKLRMIGTILSVEKRN